MRVRVPHKSEPNNYTESCMINEADRRRGRNVWYLGRSVREAETYSQPRKEPYCQRVCNPKF